MRIARAALIAFGTLAVAMGLLWIGQGLGYVAWPASSFMIGSRTWVNYGSALAVAGLLAILIARRLR